MTAEQIDDAWSILELHARARDEAAERCRRWSIGSPEP